MRFDQRWYGRTLNPDSGPLARPGGPISFSILSQKFDEDAFDFTLTRDGVSTII
jgi:hypothetical protein